MTTMIDEQLAADEGADQSLRKLHHEREISTHMREPMFEKQLTPSDVGKLNRLVIPKQHALNFFPIIHGSNNKGKKETSLSFEDQLGKSWRFRYSFWDSSQSFVFTRGWSRFVRDKRLLAGDVVVFERDQVDRDRFFIEWRARRTAPMKDSGSVAQAPTMADYSPGSSVQKPLAPTGDIKRLRLFGVNMEFRQLEPESPSLDPASLSSHDPPLSTA